MSDELEDGLRLVDAMQRWLSRDDWKKTWGSGQVHVGWGPFLELLRNGSIVAYGVPGGTNDEVKIHATRWEGFRPKARWVRNCLTPYWNAPKTGFGNWHRYLNPNDKQIEHMEPAEWHEFVRKFQAENPIEYECRENARFTAFHWIDERGREVLLDDIPDRERGTPIWGEEHYLEQSFVHETTGDELKGVRFCQAPVEPTLPARRLGRPTKTDRLDDEINRRLETGQLLEGANLSNLAEELHAMDQKAHPDDFIAVETIRKKLRQRVQDQKSGSGRIGEYLGQQSDRSKR